MQTVNQGTSEAPGERIDDLQRGGCRIIQNERMFCFGMDAVLLAAFAQVREGERVLDLCSGNGVVPILMDARRMDSAEGREAGNVHFTGVEIDPVCVDMAARSAVMNGQQDRVCFLEADIRQICTSKKQRDGEQAGDGTEPASFDVVTVNPPYMTGGTGLTSGNPALAAARHEILCTIDDVAAAAARALRFGGRLYMVHRPHRLADIFRALDAHGLAVKRIRMVHPFADREANMVLIGAVKGGRPYIHAERPLVVYREQGVYTQEVLELYG